MNYQKGFYLSLLMTVLFVACQSASKKNEEKTISADRAVEEHSAETAPQINPDSFFQAALEGDITKIETALKSGIAVDVKDAEQRTGLMLAAYNGHHRIVKLLIEKGADVNQTDTNNRSALMFASTGPFIPTVTELLNAGADPNIADNVEQWTAVMMAASEGQLEVLKLLIDRGADLTMVDVDGESAYDFAVSKGHQAVADFLKK